MNALIFKDKNFLNISYKDLKRKTRSMDTFKELTFKETSTTTTILDIKILIIFRPDLSKFLMM